MPPPNSPFWSNYNPDKHILLVRAQTQKRLALFMMLYLGVTTLTVLWLIAELGFGKIALPESLINKLILGTLGQFAGAAVICYRYMFHATGAKDHQDLR
jgi:hypothetical protein